MVRPLGNYEGGWWRSSGVAVLVLGGSWCCNLAGDRKQWLLMVQMLLEIEGHCENEAFCVAFLLAERSREWDKEMEKFLESF